MLTLANPKRQDIEPVQAEALVDTGSVYLVIPDHVRTQLQLEALSTKEVELADGSHRTIPYVGCPDPIFVPTRTYSFAALSHLI
jgi:hypothetical protein